MKLIFIGYTGSPEYDQPETWLKRINAYTGILEGLSNEHTVIGVERINYEGVYEKNGVQYLFIRLKQRTDRFPFRIHRRIKELQPDIVFVNGLIFPFQIIQLGLTLTKKTKIVVINHAEKPFTGIRKFLQRQADRYVHRYFFTSKEMGEEWVNCGIVSNENKIVEVMEVSSSFLVMDKEKAIAGTGITGSPVFLWVGRLNANKDPLTVIKAFGAFIKLQPFAKLYMIYHTEELKHEITSLLENNNALKKVVEMIGKIPHEEMQHWYSSADFIISASHYEGSGAAVCEAMSCGCVPLLTNIQSFRKMTGPGKCGLVYEPGSDAALLEILLQTTQLNMEEERKRVLQQFKEELSFEAIGKKYNAVIKAL